MRVGRRRRYITVYCRNGRNETVRWSFDRRPAAPLHKYILALVSCSSVQFRGVGVIMTGVHVEFRIDTRAATSFQVGISRRVVSRAAVPR